MKALLSTILIVLPTYLMFAQTKMRTVEELINTEESGWNYLLHSISLAKNKVEVLPCDSVKAREALYKSQVSIQSPMGAVVYSTGGLLIDNGWIRILGSGHTRLDRALPDWNKGKTFTEYGEKPPYLLIADDAIGGFFAVNGGKFGKDIGRVYYLSPDNLKWIPLDLNYGDFLNFCFFGNLNEFYKSLRWANWNEEIPELDGNKVYSFDPCLWTSEGKDINKNVRTVVAVEELYSFNKSMRGKLGLDKKKM